MSPGLPGAGIGGIFYLVAALLAPFCEAMRTIRGKGSRRQWRLVLRHFLLAVSILTMLWITAWAAGLILTSTVVTQHLGATASGLETEVITQRIAMSTLTALALVLASVEVLRLLLIRHDRHGDRGVACKRVASLAASQTGSEEHLVLPSVAGEKSL
jgi:hypothetical protein